MADAAELVVRITGDIDDIERKLDRTTKAASSFGDQMESAGRKMSSAGRSISTGFSLPLIAAGGFAIKTAMDFESAFAGVAKTVDATDAEMAQLEAGITAMSKSVPASVEEIAKVAEAAGQLGVAKENILAFSRTMIDLGETTNLTADDAATAMARIANITQMPQDQFDELASTLVALGNAGASTEADIVQMALRIAGAGSQVGLSQAQIMSFAAALSDVGVEAEAGGTAISTGFIKISQAVAEGGDALAGFADVAGMTVDQFSDKFKNDAAGAMTAFVEGLGRVKGEGGNVFQVMDDLGMSEIRLRDAFLRLAGAGDGLRTSLSTGAEAWVKNSAATDEAGKRYATTQSQLEMFGNKAKAAGATIGEQLVPVLIKVVEAAEPLGRFLMNAINWFGNLPAPVQTFMLALAGILAVAGPLLVVIGSVVSAIAAIAPVVAAVAGVILGPVGIIIALVVGIGAAIYLLWRNWDTVWGWIKGAASTAAAWVVDHLGLILGPIGWIIQAAMWLWENWDQVWAWIKGAASAARDWIGDKISAVVDFLKSLPGRAWDAAASFIDKMWDLAWEAGTKLVNAIREKLDEVVDWVKGAPGRILEALGNLGSMLWDAGWKIMMGLKDGIVAGLGAVKDFVSGIAGKIISWKGPPEYDARLLVPAGMSIMDSLVDGLQKHEKRLAAQLAQTSGMIGTIGTSVTLNRSAAPAGGIDYDRLAAAIVAALKQGGVGGTNVFPPGTDPMHMAREIAWRTGG